MKALLLTFALLLFVRPAMAQDFRGHTHDILEVKSNAEATQLISYSAGDAWLCLWEVKSGRLLWRTKTEFIQKADEYYTLTSFAFSSDQHLIASGSGNGTVQLWDAKTGEFLWRADAHKENVSAVEFSPDGKTIVSAEDYRVYSRLNADGNKLIVSGYGAFTFYDLTTGATRKIDEFSRTGSTIDLSPDGNLFAEGGSWGNAAIKITETKTGNSWLIGRGLTGQRIAPYQPSELQLRLAKEKVQRQAIVNEARARRDKQAAIDTESFRKQVYISFEHYGDMTDPGEQRLVESGEPNKSKLKKSVNDATAIWLRLHNDSPLPIKIPTQSMYLPNAECFYEFPGGKKVFGLCRDREISIWLGLENKHGKEIPFGFDFGSSAILLPKTSVVFAVEREILKNGNAIRFGFTFQKETDDKKVDDYGIERILKFREADLPIRP